MIKFGPRHLAWPLTGFSTKLHMELFFDFPDIENLSSVIASDGQQPQSALCLCLIFAMGFHE